MVGKTELLLSEIGKAPGRTDWERSSSEVGLAHVNIEASVRCAGGHMQRLLDAGVQT